MELTKKDTQMAKGMAVLGMVMLHLFCRTDNLPYTPMIWCGDIPLIYYLGLFGDLCVPVFCFCSGYAHYLLTDAHKQEYPKRLPGKALRFLCNYWIVVILFSVLGLFFDKSGQIPGSWADFAGNMLVVGMSYNGAWWFVTTYLILLAISPILAALTKRLNSIVLLACSFLIYFAAYVFRFNCSLSFESPVFQWIWNQTVLFGTSQLSYFVGMICRKYGLISMVRKYLQPQTILRRIVIVILPTAAFVGHCMIQSAFVAPFTATAVLVGLFLTDHPRWAERGLLLLGKHSTNIWLVHMFFYHRLFTGFAFLAEYPVLILALMLGTCFIMSMVIDFLYHPILALLERKQPVTGGM